MKKTSLALKIRTACLVFAMFLFSFSLTTNGYCLFNFMSRFIPAPGRTLAPWINKVYIPMFKNQSGTYGLQAELTQAVVDEFLADGRLKVETNDNADVRIEGTILSFNSITESTTSDNIPIVTRYTMTCLIKLYDSHATDRSVPLARYTVKANTRFISDTRRMINQLETDARAELYDQMAYNITQAVIYGKPDPMTTQEKQALSNYKSKNNPASYEPEMSEPKLPRYTPIEE